MNLMTLESTSQRIPAAIHTNAFAETISYATSECALGQVLVARSVKGVCAILIGANREEVGAELAARFPAVKLAANEGLIHDDVTKVTRFVDKPTEGLCLPLDMRGTPFQRLVWEKIRAIPVGRTVTYSELAYWVGPLTSARAVAAACAANAIALAIPCHRVVRSNRDLSGYRWGAERRSELIKKEATT